jgi:hypothetical protein
MERAQTKMEGSRRLEILKLNARTKQHPSWKLCLLISQKKKVAAVLIAVVAGAGGWQWWFVLSNG